MIIPLKQLLRIFNDFNRSVCGIQIIRMMRSKDNNGCPLVKDRETTAKVPPNGELKLQLLK